MLGTNQDEHLKRSVDWAERALRVDPATPQAHLILGLVQILEGDPQEALRHLKSAHGLDPGDWETQQWLAYLYGGVGRHEEALVHARALKALDPGEPLGDLWEAWVHLCDGRIEEAATIMGRVPVDWDNPHRLLGLAQMESWQGNRERALDFLGSVEGSETFDYMTQMCLLYREALLGDHVAFEQHMTPDLVQTVEADAWGAHMVAELYCVLGDFDSALRWLDRAASWGWINYPLYARTDPLLEGLRGDPRYQAFLDRVKKQWDEFEV
jgi:tetratricopeptide (TPR) repeat protein